MSQPDLFQTIAAIGDEIEAALPREPWPWPPVQLLTCRSCGLAYRPCAWLPHRAAGYCRAACLPKPTVDANESTH